MVNILVVIFVVAYAAIALEHPIQINKSASALLAAGLLWTVYAVLTGDHQLVGENLTESLASTAQIVFFLMGAMIIVGVAAMGREKIHFFWYARRIAPLALIGCLGGVFAYIVQYKIINV
jgi:drug/metabolite transporter (DMT)-like permease